MQQRECSSKLRNRIDKYLRLFMDDLWHMYKAVTQALKNRIEAVRAAKEHVQDHLLRVGSIFKQRIPRLFITSSVEVLLNRVGSYMTVNN